MDVNCGTVFFYQRSSLKTTKTPNAKCTYEYIKNKRMEIELAERNEEVSPFSDGDQPKQRTCMNRFQKNLSTMSKSKCIMLSLFLLLITLGIALIRDR